LEFADAVRVEVAVRYKTRAWQTVAVDLGPGEAGEVDLVAPAIPGLAEMGLPMAPHVRCLGINEQVAQKLHACTGPQREDRARMFSIFSWWNCWANSTRRGLGSPQQESLPSAPLTRFHPVPLFQWNGDRNWRILPKSSDTRRQMPRRSKRGLPQWSRRSPRPQGTERVASDAEGLPHCPDYAAAQRERLENFLRLGALRQTVFQYPIKSNCYAILSLAHSLVCGSYRAN
jgi:hypothetical protein